MSKFHFKYIFILGCIYILAACSSSQSYTASDMDLPEEFQIPDSVAINMDTILIARNKLFKDTVLVNLIDKAFKHNFDLRTVNKEIEINDAYYKQSKAAFYPELNLNLLGIEKEWRSRNSRQNPESRWYAREGKEAPQDGYVSRSTHYTTAALNWEIDIWGKIRNQKKSAAALYEQSKVAKKTLQTQLVSTVAQDYYSLLMLDEQLAVAEKNHKFRDSTLSMIRLLYSAGEVTALAVQQSQSQVLEASRLISQLKERREIQENNLRLLTGQLPGNTQRGIGLSFEDVTYENVKEIPLYMIQNRPDVLVSQYGLIAANARVGVAQAQRLPNLSISLTGGVESLLAENWFNIPGSLLGGITGGLTQPVFRGRRLKTQYEVAKIEREIAEIDFQRKVYEAIVDVENILISIKRLEEQFDIAVVNQLVAQQALQNSRMLFQSGFADYLEVITAQGEAMQTELNLADTKASLLTAQIQLYRALGGGWE